MCVLWGLGFGVGGLRIRVECLGLGFGVLGLRFRGLLRMQRLTRVTRVLQLIDLFEACDKGDVLSVTCAKRRVTVDM